MRGRAGGGRPPCGRGWGRARCGRATSAEHLALPKHFCAVADSGDGRLLGSELRRLRELVQDISYRACDGQTETACKLRLNEQRLHDADEAWVPVLAPDGPGVLVWPNSD